MKNLSLKNYLLFLLFIPFVHVAQTLTTSFSPSVQCYSQGGNSATGIVQTQVPGAVNYTWQVTAPAACAPPNIFSFSPDNSFVTIYFSCCGVYTVDCIALDGATMFMDAYTATVEISCGSPIALNTLPSNSVFCAGSSATLSASGATSYTWLPGNTNGSSLLVNTAGCYTVIGSGGAGCDAEAVSCVTVQTVSFTVSPLTQTVCAAGNATIVASGASSYTWNTNATTSSVVVTPSVSSIYTVTGGTGNCTVKKTATVTVVAPTVSVSSNVPLLCRGKSATLTASGAVSYTWSNSSATVSSIVVSPTTTTNYTVTGKNAAGCTAKAIKTQSVAACVGIEEEEEKGVALLYPNPTPDKITIVNRGLSDIVSIDVYNIQGQLIFSRKGSFNILEIDLEGHPAGLFFVSIGSKESTGMYKIIKLAD